MVRSSINVKNYNLKRSFSMPTMMPSELSRVGEPTLIQPVGAVFDDGSDGKFRGMLDIEEKVDDVITLENDTALFECKVLQDLKPTCTWHKDGIALQTDDERISVIKNSAWHRLEIKQVTFSDQGIYAIECRHKKRYISVKGRLFVAPRQINDGVFYHKIKYAGTGVMKHLNNIKVTKGENVVLKVIFRYASEEYTWYKNNDLVLLDRTTTEHCGSSASLTITNVKPTDAGVYCVVAKTEQGYLSSFADVQVSDCYETRQVFPILEEYLPNDLEALVGEEVRLVAKVHTDSDTIISWVKDSGPLHIDDFLKIDYGNNYIGLNILSPVKSSEGEYRLTLMNSKLHRVVATSTYLTVNQPLSDYPKVDLLRPLDSAVACCGAKVTFDCRYDLHDPIYFYVVWYIGHYRVERTNSHFNVICNGGQFLLYIKKLEPSMAGDVICELRRAWPNRKSVMIRRAYARLVIVPLPVIREAKKPVVGGKLYYEREADDGIWIEDIDGDTQKDPEYLLKIVYCRLDDTGLFFVHAVRGANTEKTTSLKIHDSTDTNRKAVVLKWNTSIVTEESWYAVELGQANGSFTEVGITSRPYFGVENPPLDRMMIFRIRAVAVDPMSHIYDAEVYIVPPPEIILRMPVPHEVQPMDTFNAKYTNTNDLIGTGAFGSVSLVRDNADGAHYAAKFVKARIEIKKDHILREYHIMKNLRHPKLIELIGFYESKVMFVFVMEFCWGGELFDRVVAEEYLKEVDVVGYVRQICEGLEYIHKKSIVHLDLKPENIICMSPNSLQVKLIDFGVARNVNEDYPRAIYGTRDYVAPEIIDYEPITTATDMWSLGVVTYTLLSGVMPFAGENWVERSVNITRACYDYDDYAFGEVSDLAKNFVDHLLLRRPGKRMSATQALQHKWIKEGPQVIKPKHMNKMQQNLKSYLADYRSRWQRAGNVMIAAHRLRMMMRPEPASGSYTPEIPSEGDTSELPSGRDTPEQTSDGGTPELPFDGYSPEPTP